MRILHYSLGFPPYRTGGLTKYVIDLSKSQLNSKNIVYILWPGRMSKFNKKISFYEKKVDTNYYSLEMKNPLPVPLLDGIKDINAFVKKADKEIFRELLSAKKIDVVHIHTLMGLYSEFVEACNDLNIPILYTTHDYFGICPKVNLFIGDKPCAHYLTHDYCLHCNDQALSMSQIYFMQSKLYRMIKNTNIVSYLRQLIKDERVNDNVQKSKPLASHVSSQVYKHLSSYYLNIFQCIDYFQFNSQLTKKIYTTFCNDIEGTILPVLNTNISDNRIPLNAIDKVRINYLGTNSIAKGFPFLIKCLDVVWEKYPYKFELNIFFNTSIDRPYLKKNRPYSSQELIYIMKKCNLVIVPSVWYETFGFVVLEALSYGRPVIVSKNVGSIDYINDSNGYIFDLSEKDLISKLEFIINNPSDLLIKNRNILSTDFNFDFSKHSNEVIKLYKQLIYQKNFER